MRNLLHALIPAALLLVCGCGGDGSPVGSGGGSADGGLKSVDGHTDDNPGSAGTSCQTACDCQPGLSCNAGKCGSGGAAYYCCTSSSCPMGSGCQNDTGSLGVCGGGSGGGGGAGGGGAGGGAGGPGFDLGGLGGGGLPGFGDGGLPGGGGGGGGGGLFCAILTCTQDSECSAGPGAAFGCTKCNAGHCQ